MLNKRLIWLKWRHLYNGALMYFKNIFHFLTFQTSKFPKRAAKNTKNMTLFPCFVRPEKSHPYETRSLRRILDEETWSIQGTLGVGVWGGGVIIFPKCIGRFAMQGVREEFKGAGAYFLCAAVLYIMQCFQNTYHFRIMFSLLSFCSTSTFLYFHNTLLAWVAVAISRTIFHDAYKAPNVSRRDLLPEGLPASNIQILWTLV